MTSAMRKPEPVSGSVLNAICEEKRREVAVMPISCLTQRVRRGPVSLENSLVQPGPGFILECKRASPSQGIIRHTADLVKIAKEYSIFANAISVLTDENFFNGSIEDLRAIGAATSLPLLAKDFFIDERQIRRAYAAGADAILLMLSVLSNDEYRHLAKVAKSCGMDILTEVHTEDELERANGLGARIIGINNRDLNTLDVNLNTTKKLATGARKGAVLVSESGYSNRQQILQASNSVDAFLIGSSIMASHRPDLKMRQLIFGDIKICGLTRPEDAALAFSNGATFGGLNFVKGTSRAINLAQAKNVLSGVDFNWVGVFRGSDPSHISQISKTLKLDVVQLHGNETDSFRMNLRKILPIKTEVWQAVEGSKFDPDVQYSACDRLILDTRKQMEFGGTGKAFNWGNLRNLKSKAKLGLAGGLSPENIKSAIKTGIPLLDICSGVESGPGIKSGKKLADLFKSIRIIEGY